MHMRDAKTMQCAFKSFFFPLKFLNPSGILQLYPIMCLENCNKFPARTKKKCISTSHNRDGVMDLLNTTQHHLANSSQLC